MMCLPLSRTVLAVLLLAGSACGERPATFSPQPVSRTESSAKHVSQATPGVSVAPSSSVAPSASVAPPPSAPVPASPPSPRLPALPAHIQPGEPVVMKVPGDSPIHVFHAPASSRRAMVYLHGVCGDILAIRSWAKAAAEFATLIALYGDAPCRTQPGRYSWRDPLVTIQKRILHAVEIVAAAREGLLDRDSLTLFGYSQGAARAERLVEQYPERYPYVILGGPPTEPAADPLGSAKAVVVIGGERENTDHMEAGAKALVSAGRRARFLVFPSASHGQFGPEASRVIREALTWLYAEPD